MLPGLVVDPSVTIGPVVGSRKSYPDLDGLASARVPSFLLPNGTYCGTGIWKRSPMTVGPVPQRPRKAKPCKVVQLLCGYN